MTSAEIIALLCAHPAEALEAVKAAKIAGPRKVDYAHDPVWESSYRLSIRGEKVGIATRPQTALYRRYGDPSGAEHIAQQDQRLIDDGWVLL